MELHWSRLGRDTLIQYISIELVQLIGLTISSSHLIIFLNQLLYFSINHLTSYPCLSPPFWGGRVGPLYFHPYINNTAKPITAAKK
jgi:hypothetical protein